MVENSLERLKYLLQIIPEKITQISDDEFSYKPIPEKWSKKEILGHLIDSAANNSQRFIRAQYEEVPYIVYNQDSWNFYNRYQDLDREHILNFWIIYNTQILYILKGFSEANFQKQCSIGSVITLAEVAEGYVEHLEHHLKQIVNY